MQSLARMRRSARHVKKLVVEREEGEDEASSDEEVEEDEEDEVAEEVEDEVSAPIRRASGDGVEKWQ